jgi:tRNA-splicing ligase RtcB
MKQIADKIFQFGEHDDQTIEQINMIASDERVYRAVLAADGHLGYSMPIGGVAAYMGVVSPSGVGYDIGCGNLAVRTTFKTNNVGYWSDLVYEIARTISFGIGQVNKEIVESAMVYSHDAWNIPAVKELLPIAQGQLGTVGAGNHFVDILKDEHDWLWVGVHFGSRGFGHHIAQHYIKAGGGKDGIMQAPTLLDVNSELGKEYITAMQLAGLYAMAGRTWVVERVLEIMGAQAIERVHNHHNFAWKERHEGRDFWVIRKGATPAFPGQRGFIGGSMGDISAIVEGVDTEASRTALYSTVHGAGRLMSRTQAAGKKKWVGGKMVRTGKGQISREMMNDMLLAKKVILYGGDTDEAPQVYRPLDNVLKAQGETIRILHTLEPMAVLMAPADVEDPFKD